jgi:hypothetical protein
MDPLSITASLTALLGLAATVIRSGYAVAQAMKDFQEDHNSLAVEIKQLSGILYRLKPLAIELDNLSALGDVQSQRRTLQSGGSKAPDECKHVLSFLRRLTDGPVCCHYRGL